jgi:hypothetical protein
MADNYLLGPTEDIDANKSLGTTADFAKTLGAGALDVGSNAAAGARYFYELGGSEAGADITQGLQKIFRAGSESISDTMNPETRKLAAATLTSKEFWEHPVLGTALKTTGMLPSVAALAIPGGLLADVASATVFAASAGAALNAGDAVDQFYQRLDKMSDKELQEEAPKYRAMREMMGEKDARARFNREAQGWGPALNAIIGAASGAVGPAGVAARAIAGAGKSGANAVVGAGERGAIKSAGIAAVGGATTNALEEGTLDFTVQNAELEAGLRKEFDIARTANAALEGGALGGLLGGGVGGAVGGKTKPKAVERIEDMIATTDTPDPQAKTGTTGTAAKPAEIVANPQNAPTTTDRDMGKTDTKTAPPKLPTTPPPVPVDPAIAQAVAANEGQPVTAEPTEVAAMTQRSPNETLDKLDQEGKAPAAAPVPPGVTPPADTGMNVPEQPASLAEQIKQIGTGDRKAMMAPKGTLIPAAALGGRTDLKRHTNGRGTFIYDPKLTNIKEINKLSKDGRENELLGLGPVSKPVAVADAAAGATPVAITERTPTGTEVKAAAGTTATLPEQVASLEAQKSPGNAVAVETPGAVLEKRNAAGGRILPNLAVTAETTPLKDLTYTEPAAPGEGPGKNYRGKAGALRDEKIAKAKNIVERNAPDVEFERGYLQNPTIRDKVIARAEAMVEDAKKVGLTVQAQLKKSGKGDAASDDPAIQILRLAKDLAKVASKHKEGAARTEATKVFAEAERLIRAGHSDEVLATRREEGDARFKKNVAGEQVAAATVETPAAAADEVSMEGGANERIVGKDDVTTSTAASSKMGMRGVGAGTEDVVNEKGETVTRAKAAKTRVLSDEEIAAYAAKMGLSVKKGAPVRAPVKAKLTERGVSEETFRKLQDTLRKDEAKEAATPVEELTATQKAKRVASEAIKKQLESGEDAAAAWLAANDKPPQQEALRINRNPTPAQVKAGNYKKGHRRIEGLDFTIETPVGAVRKGFDEDGRETWRVKAPADYGYIRGTKGADGEQIDAHDLKTGKRHFIVDQLDERTGEFDEHKVMLRAKDEQHAVSTYVRAYSDGKGPDRLGNIHEVTMSELKEWVDAADTTKPATAEFLDRDMGAVNFDVRPGQRAPVEAGNGVQVHPMRSTTAAAELDRLDMSQLQGLNTPLAKFFQSRLRRLAGEAEVHFVTQEDMTRLAPGAVGASGLHVRNRQTGHSEIYILHTLAEGGQFGSVGHVLLHELTHAATVREIERVPGAEAMINRLAKIAHDHMSLNLVELDLELGQGVIDYGFTNAKEFMAEAFSNPKFQEFLSRIPIDQELARYLGVDRAGPMSAWDVVRKFVQKAIERVTGKLPADPTVLDGILKVGEHLTKIHEVDHPSPFAHDRVGSLRPEKRVQAEAFRIVDRAVEQVKELIARPENNTAAASAKALRIRTFDNIAQLGDYFFGKDSNPVRKIHDAIERMRITAEGIQQKSEPLIRNMAELRAKNKAAFNEFSSLLHDATVANVHPDVSLTDPKNAHLGKNALRGVWSKAQHVELTKRYNALPEEFKALWHKTTKHFADQQNAMSLGIIENQVLKLLGINDAALAQRIHEGNLTDIDRTLLGGNLDVIERAAELSKIEGPYVPLMRRGDHVVKGDYKVTQPGNAKKISDNEFEFVTRKEAEDYAKASPLLATVEKIWIDPATGERLGANELASVDRYRVEVQNRHVEFIQGRRAAEARAAELAKDGSIAVHEVVPRSFEPDARQGAELSTALSRLVKKLEHSDAYKAATPTQRTTLRQAITEASLASHGSTRVSSRALPRRGVQGFSEDLVQNTVDYGSSSSRYLAKLEHGAQMEAGLKEMAEAMKQDHDKGKMYGRTAISNEVRHRVEGDNGYQQGGVLAPVVKRLLSISFSDKLGSPAYSIINAMQTAMITVPYLSARYGIGRSFAAMGKAYADINAASIVKGGLTETIRKFAAKEGVPDFMALVMHKLNANEKAMIKAHLEVGTIDAAAGMEIASIVKDYSGVGGKADAVLGYLEGVTRQMPRAVETINRSATALAAYRLEIARGGAHEQAVAFSKDSVNNTQFNYSPTNSPPVFNHPLLKIALQFKKYGQGMYQLIGSQVGYAMRNESPGDRARAVKTLLGIAATHTAMAGALGLPTEPFKYLLMGASAMGLPVGTWGDVEDKVRRGAAQVFGKTGGEVFSRGLPRLFNIDLSRMGLDSVTSFGEPRGAKEADVKSWLFDNLSGPVVSLGGDYIKGANLAANGEFGKAAEKVIPLKAASDALRAYRQATEGKKSSSNKQTMSPYTPTETGLRALGFGSGREAEVGAAAGAYYRQAAVQKEARAQLVDAWVQAKPAEKTKAWAAIQKWNQGQPAEVKINPAELTSKAKRDAKTAEKAVRGITPNKRDKRFLDEGFVYNTR